MLITYIDFVVYIKIDRMKCALMYINRVSACEIP